MQEPESRSLPTPRELRNVLPKDWIPFQDIVRPTRTRKVHSHDSIVICKSYLSLPLPVWQKLGSPAFMTAYFNCYDVILMGSKDIEVYTSKYAARILFGRATPRFRDYLNPGRYPVGSFVEGSHHGIRFVRILKAGFTYVDKKFPVEWRELLAKRPPASSCSPDSAS